MHAIGVCKNSSVSISFSQLKTDERGAASTNSHGAAIKQFNKIRQL